MHAPSASGLATRFQAFTLTRAHFAFIRSQAERAGFASDDEYLSALIQSEMDRQSIQDRLPEDSTSNDFSEFDRRFFVDLVAYAIQRDRLSCAASQSDQPTKPLDATTIACRY
ncbi:MAG: hypothetical protein EOP37_20405 [Rubrivivax sp.]|nr:MAG: hypothetical protein EOP37_20405 [Rubrivivax sp.]